MAQVELALLMGLGTLMVLLVPRALARVDTQGQRRPHRVGWWVALACATLVAGGFWLFRSRGWLFDGAGMSIAFAGVLASLVSSSTLEVQRDNRRLAAAEHALRDEAARIAGEMEAARRIQLGSLPDAGTAFPGEVRFAVSALIEPAREVGGDLFDFFMVDERRLCFLIGDVSGKGVPASMFMAVTRTLSRSFATRLPGGPAEIVSAANRDLSSGNVETLFVTLLLGVLDVDTGELELVNAGHDAPWHLTEQQPPQQIVAGPDAGGPPLCVLDDFVYTVQRVQLTAGDRLCMVTDGITEAADDAGQMYGSGRMLRALARADDGGADGIVRELRQDVGQFVAGAEASDDMAILVVHWFGPAGAA
jgi:serine phosphatase RsbU (regulator of sigma subunit)